MSQPMHFALHTVLCQKIFFEPVLEGRMRFFLCKYDKYLEGDRIVLQEYDDVRRQFTGRQFNTYITYVQRSSKNVHEEARAGYTQLGLWTGWCVLGLGDQDTEREEAFER